MSSHRLFRFASAFAVAACVALTLGKMSFAGQFPGYVSTEILNEPPPTPSCHASTIAETPRGLIAAWFGGTREGDSDVGIWLTRQQDGKWTSPLEVANGIQNESLRHPCWNPVLFQVPGGPLQLYYKVGPSPSEWWGMMMTSYDGGQSWGKPTRLPDQILGPIKNKPVMLGDGRMLAGSSSEHDGWRVHLEATHNLGTRWSRTPNLTGEVEAIQPTILIHPDKKVQILCRGRDTGRVVEAWSNDNGRTWSPLSLTDLPNPNSGIDAVNLADGRFLLIYNHTPRGRSPLNIAVSDDGRKWQAGGVLENEPGEYSYPAVIQAADGHVHITYTWKRLRVKHVVVNPAKLELKPLEQ